LQHREYIVQNSVKAGLADTARAVPGGYTYLAKKKAQGLKAQIFVPDLNGPTKVRP
jgi:hypothetical protein